MSPTLHRLVTFNLVGVLGAIVHLATLSIWSRWLGLPAPLASLLAVEAALIHNFLWHERWTWRDRWPADGRMGRLLRFHGANGLVSVAGSGLLVPCLMHAGLAVEAAGIMAIVACSLVNFRLADRGVFTSAVAMLALCAGARPAGASPQPDTLDGWHRYVSASEVRRAGEIAQGGIRLPDEQLRSLRAGTVEVQELETRSPHGETIDVPDGLVHHWRGRMFVPGITLDRLLERVRDPALHRAQPDVREARVLRQDDDELDLFLRITRSQFVTVTYDTRHHVRYARQNAARATATSVATRIDEVGGDDRGFLWRLNAYWRYEVKDGGVLVECESISLSRTVPLVLRPVAGRAVRGFARESMSRTLTALRQALTRSLPAARVSAVALDMDRA